MNIFKHIMTAALLFCAGMGVQAQDLLANQAPIDHKMRKIDSLSIQHLIDTETKDDPAMALYNEWRNDHVRQYGNVARPTNYKIDLRHFHMPTPSRLVTSNYGYRRSFRRMHYGIDVKVYVGDTIYAAFSGKVRVVADQGRKKGYGKYVVIRHPNGLETVYGHLSKQLVATDQIVKAGEPIALGGNTGRSTGSHLHFECLLLGDPINPAEMFDFVSQDVKGDYYVYNGHGRGYIVDAENGETRRDLAARGEVEHWTPTAEQLAVAERAAAKAEESREFQQQRMSQRRASVYKVRRGDTLSSIAKRNGTTVDKLCRLNGIRKTSKLSLGQIIKVS